MQTQVAAHQGEIVHFYGNGCWVLFNLPQDAAQAGIALQQDFQKESIPVRIGIHSGTVNVDYGLTKKNKIIIHKNHPRMLAISQ